VKKPAINGDAAWPRRPRARWILPTLVALMVGMLLLSIPGRIGLASPSDASGFAPTGSMTMSRAGAQATLLTSGTGGVLVVGGYDSGTGRVTDSAEFYDPASGTFTATGSMALPRYNFAMAQLKDGRILVAVTSRIVGKSGKEVDGNGHRVVLV